MRQAWEVIEPATPFVPGWHIGAICEHLQAVTEGQIQNLVITVPPGCTKSIIAGVCWPAWEWTRDPSARWLTASNETNLATRDAVACRRLIESDWYQECWGDKFRMTTDQNIKRWYENDKRGFRTTTTTDSMVSGKKGKRLLVDDPDDAEKVESEAERKKVHGWWDKAFYNRVNDHKTGSRAVIGQRLHRDDLIGHILRAGGFVELRIPEEFEPDRRCTTPLPWSDPRTEPGELLRPERFGKEQVAQARARLGRGYLAQHQQRDTGGEGAEWPDEYFGPGIWFEDWPTDLQLKVISLDPSKGKDAKFGDYSAFVSLGVDRERRLWVDADLARRPSTRIVEDGLDHYRRWRPEAFAVETNVWQELLAADFLREAGVRDVTLPVYGVNNQVKKEVRIRRIGPFLAQGRIRFKGGSAGAEMLVQQLKDFPEAEFDDAPDALEVAIRMAEHLMGERDTPNQPHVLRAG